MTILDSLLLGAVEGVTEFLPISSTVHVSLFAHLNEVGETPFLNVFVVVIQLAAIAAVLTVFWRKFFDFETIKKLVTAFLPIGIAGFMFGDKLSGALENMMVILLTLVAGGVLLIAAEKYSEDRELNHGSENNITYKAAFLIGLFQILALIPGFSRLGATLIGSLLLGFTKKAALEFSLLLGLPTVGVASIFSLITFPGNITRSDYVLLFYGGVIAFIVGIFSLRFILWFINRYRLAWFGWYRIALAGTLFFYFF